MTNIPNPNNGLFTIESDVASTYVVYDLLGKTITEGILHKGKNQVTLQGHENGLYVLKIKNQPSAIKLVKH